MLPAVVLTAMHSLEAAGFEVFAVGGCVRDILLKIPPHDWDLTTNALPEEIMACLSNFKQITTGLKHGTVTVLIDHEPIEITTYRTDGNYPDHRHPEKVSFTQSLSADLARRDFTVNAMAMDRAENVYDFFGGKADLTQKKIRCVGDAQKRFTEDALRILRGIRFASAEGFTLEQQTLAAANALAASLNCIARERIAAELKKTLSLPNAGSVIQQTLPVFKTIFPSLSCSRQQWALICSYIKASNCRPEIAFAHLLTYTDFEKELAQLKIENILKNKIRILLENKNSVPENKKASLACLMCRLGREYTFLLVEFFISRGELNSSVRKTAALAAEGCCSLQELDLRGDDLKAIGYKGREIKAALLTLLTAVAEEKCENKKEKLLRYINQK